METKNCGFLREVAADIYRRYGDEVGEVKMLFPSRRARVFFTDALSQIAEKPIWEPEWISIDDIMSRVAQVEVGEHIRLITELFRVYKRHHKNESFDRFYYWGEVLLADFDMVDKYLIDAEQIFRNISDIKELETDLSYLTPQQLQIVAFWSSVGGNGGDLSKQKERFLVVWRSLLPIYIEYKERLRELGIAYSGMVHRIAAERISSDECEVVKPTERYVIAGFNALSECEKVLFDAIKTGSTAHFYWDWDDYYTLNSGQEAGLFLKENRTRYIAAIESSHNCFAEQKRIEAVACSSVSLQCKYVSKIIEDIASRDGIIDKRTAIVLTDESLLLPLLYSLPECVGKVNVTMGYPIRQTLAYSFIERLIELQQHARESQSSGVVSFYHLNVLGLLSHPYLEAEVGEELLHQLENEIEQGRLINVPAKILHRSELLSQIFSLTRGWRERSEYLAQILGRVASLSYAEEREDADMRVEFLTLLQDHILQLQHSIEECQMELESSTYISLLRRNLQPLRIPYEGEPLEGLQVMGILETRTLDFDNVILLSMNDDNFPGSRVAQPSYIPYSLRSAYDLPTPEHHDGVYAYYFYRLIQRAKRVSMLYCSRADDKSTGEQSRYITQLELESPHNIKRVEVGVDVNLFSPQPIEIEKCGRIAEQLRRFTSEYDVVGIDGVIRREIKRLSPTALFQYVACPLRFYYKSLANIRVGDELSEDVDSPMFGNILHDSMERLYREIVGSKEVEKELRAIKKERVVEAVNAAIRGKYLMDSDSAEPLSGNLILVQEVVVNYIFGGVLRYDIANPPREILGVESRAEYILQLSDKKRVRFEGICDRIDRMADGSIRIVDYKTGSQHLDFAGVEMLFSGKGRDRQSNIFQTLLYSYMLRDRSPQVTPQLYYVRSMNDVEYSPLLCDASRGKVQLQNYAEVHEEFEEKLLETLNELFDESIPFRQCEDSATCLYCDFAQLCHRD